MSGSFRIVNFDSGHACPRSQAHPWTRASTSCLVVTGYCRPMRAKVTGHMAPRTWAKANPTRSAHRGVELQRHQWVIDDEEFDVPCRDEQHGPKNRSWPPSGHRPYSSDHRPLPRMRTHGARPAERISTAFSGAKNSLSARHELRAGVRSGQDQQTARDGKLADELGCDASNTTQVVTRLEAREMVKRHQPPDDRRSRNSHERPLGTRSTPRSRRHSSSPAQPPPTSVSKSRASSPNFCANHSATHRTGLTPIPSTTVALVTRSRYARDQSAVVDSHQHAVYLRCPWCPFPPTNGAQ